MTCETRNDSAPVPDVDPGRYDGGRARISRTEATRTNTAPRKNV